MEKQKHDRIKILGILLLVFLVVPLITVSASAASGSGDLVTVVMVMADMVAAAMVAGEIRFDIIHRLLMAIVEIARSSADLMDVTGIRP